MEEKTNTETIENEINDILTQMAQNKKNYPN